MAEPQSGFQALLDELKRRRVVRVAVLYIAVALAALQGLDLVLPALGAPEAAFTVLVRALVVGLPLALALSWVYDVTPHGLVRTSRAGEPDAARPGWFALPSLVVVGAIGFALGAGWIWGGGTAIGDPARDGSSDPRLASAASGEYSIAVLPLENLSADPDDEYFSDGLTDEVRAALGRIDGVRTAARSSTFALKGLVEDVRTLGRRLGVEAVLAGSVRRSGDDVRINVSLGQVDDGLELWTDSYDAKMADVFSVQSRIAEEIAGALRMTLSEDDAARIASPPTTNSMALDKYRWGRFNWNRRSAEGLTAAIANFEEALDFDPEFAGAWAGLADAWVLMPEYSDEIDPEIALARADSAATRALDFDPDLAAAHGSRGLIRTFSWDWRAAETAFEKAIEVDPDYATARQWYAMMLASVGRVDEAYEQIRAAAAADPLSSVMRQDEARVLVMLEREDEALSVLQDVIATDPGFAPASGDAGWIFLEQGRFDDARNAFDLAAERERLDPTPMRDFVGGVERYEREGAPQPLPAGFDRMGDVTPTFLAGMEVLLGNPGAALDRLESALERRAWDLITVGALPPLHALRGEPRYETIVRAVGAERWLER
ncbi:MAG: tetratricopeptide repeat protein [Gemmatimonadetes bacterium]|nr:tetratricopeptide repeat protein [Gemmatimonadota bacterium]